MLPSEADVEALLNQGAVVRAPFRWVQVGRTNWKAEVWLEDTYEAARVKLVGTYNHRTRNLTYTLVWANCRIRSLDMGGPAHRNPDGREFDTPHKHRWTDDHRDRVVYAPDDITAADREGVFRQFLNECGIRFESVYQDAVAQGDLL